MDIDQWENAAQAFECSLMGLRKDKNGWVVLVSVHPDDVPNTLLDSPLGTRFQAVFFEVGDDEKPVELIEVKEGKKLLAEAGELCRKESFLNFLLDHRDQFGLVPLEDWDHKDGQSGEDFAAMCLRRILGIESRSEIATSKDVQGEYKDLIQTYRDLGLDLPF
tara:strand:+ start:492 stop:980 length:489 start_codon:yes stop_codon:yes gene_type:complete